MIRSAWGSDLEFVTAGFFVPADTIHVAPNNWRRQIQDLTPALYIDFECLKGTPPHPALLGVLTGSEDEDLQQVITDLRLAPAVVANRDRLVVSPASDAADTVVANACVNGLRIIGWSFFDRDRLIDACPQLADEINTRYVNALQIARPWRHHLHPAVVIEREDEYAPKHTLDKYAQLAGYPDSRKLMNAHPAKWIRHTLDQLDATGGSYRRVTKQAKRDWHTLLEYNRHDCLALRHIALKAARELECWRAYERTRFCVEDRAFRPKAEATGHTLTPRQGRICFMAGSRNRALAAMLERHRARRWAFITAWNPGSSPLPRTENDARQAQLRGMVEKRGFRVLPGQGIREDPAWPPEESLMVLGISEGEAVRLGQRFGQLAIVAGERGSTSRLVPCTSS